MSLNKEARLREERKKLKESNKRLPLNRPFPYEVAPFPADFFGIDTYSDDSPDPALTSDEA